MEGDRQISTIYATIEWNCGAAQHGKGPPDLAAVRLQVLTISSSERESVAVVRAIMGYKYHWCTAKKT